jgi:hypothetical protein
MKKICSDTYLKKISQYGLPGDPSLPPGVSHRMIDDAAGGDPQEGQKKVEWLVYDDAGIEYGAIVTFDYTDWGADDLEGQNLEIDLISVVDKKTGQDLLNGVLSDETISTLKNELAEDIDNI